ncbi:AAA family ATPase [Streptomyces chartreusis]|uniref:AAA family ATPase n=1 Tax=Streptomyces chartreusis TaxID=1969 RepID=A0A7H8T114_STRCX|nr:AAA family ATPase [Streptomyces chartreusis]QKZ17044.1 AAA family ATPase [Streptomyces chartreusis]
MLALSMPLTRDENGSSPRPDLDPLDGAPTHAHRVAQALSGFEYEEFPAQSEHADWERLVESLVTASDIAVLIVHVVGHGELADGSSEKLYILGRDAERLRQPVSGWIEWIEDHPNRHRPVTLFILDVCCAGEAAVTAWHARMDVSTRRAWVLAAAGPQEKAFEYRLSRALVQVLERYLRGERRIDPSVRYIPANTLWKEVEATVLELVAEEDGVPQSVLTSLVPSHADLSALPFFPNPGFVEADPEEWLPPEIARLTDLAVDPLHFMRRAGGAEPVQRDWREGYFSGRKEDLSRLARWLDDESADPSLCVVTGKPGAGKSALIGMLVCAALPDLREFTKPLWRGRADTVPGTNDRLVVIHARHMAFDEMARALSAQVRRLVPLASLPSQAAGSLGEDSAASLFALLEERQQSERPITIIIDALDESNDPETITEALLYPLTRRYRGMVRLLIATRKDTRVNVLLTARNGYEILDLDTTVPESLCEDLLVYVKRLLAAAGPYTPSSMRQAGNALAEAIAARLADTDDEPDVLTPEYLQLGEFLTAGIYVNFMLTSTEHSSQIEEATRTGHAVPRSLPDLLAMDLQRHGDQPLLRAVLTALAFAQGQGMPELVLADVVTFDPSGQGRKVPLQTLYRLLDNEARLYLSRSVDEDGTTLYRLFHQGVADWWRKSASPEDLMQLYQSLAASVRRDEQERPLWHLATPYLQRHLPQHAADAGCLHQLLEDGDYLAFADPSVLLKLLPHVMEPLGEQAESNAAAYGHAFAERTSMPLAARRQLLAATAALGGNRPLQETLERSMQWRVRWAVSASAPPTALAAFTSRGQPYAVTGTELGRVEVWDVHSGEAMARSAAPRGRRVRPASEIRALTVVDSVGQLRIVTGGDNGIRTWDPLTGALSRKLPGHTGSTAAMTTVQLAERCHLLVGGYGGFSIWDLAARKQTGELVDHGAWVDALATTYTRGRLSIVTGADNGRIQVWDLNAGKVARDISGHVDGVKALAVTHLGTDLHAVSAGEEGIVYLWNLETGSKSRELTDHQGDLVRGLAVVDLPGRPHAVTGHESGRTALWDLTTGTCMDTFQLPTAVTAVATSSDGAILVTSADGIAALTLTTLSGEPVNPGSPTPCR